MGSPGEAVGPFAGDDGAGDFELLQVYGGYFVRAGYGYERARAIRFVDNNADVATFSPLGRFVYGTVTVTF